MNVKYGHLGPFIFYINLYFNPRPHSNTHIYNVHEDTECIQNASRILSDSDLLIQEMDSWSLNAYTQSCPPNPPPLSSPTPFPPHHDHRRHPK